MTLCIAATCMRPIDNPIPGTHIGQVAVVAYDRRIFSPEQATADIGHKVLGLAPRWFCMVAGDVAWALEVARSCRTTLADATLTIDNLPDRLREAIRLHAIRQHVTGTYGISYDDVIGKRRKSLGESLVQKIVTEAGEAPWPQQQIIFVGWIEPHFVMVVYHNGVLWIEENIAAIGSGAPVASMMLHLRGQQPFSDIPETVYTVYEASRVGSYAREVGSWTAMSVIDYDPALDSLSFRDINGRPPPNDFLNQQYEKFRPQRVSVQQLPHGLLGEPRSMFKRKAGGKRTRGEPSADGPGTEEADAPDDAV